MGIGLLIGIVIGVSIGSSFGPSGGDLQMAMGQCEIVRDDYSAALDEANTNIEDANSQIYDAQSYAWSSYDEMGGFLENMQEISMADDPQTSCY